MKIVIFLLNKHKAYNKNFAPCVILFPSQWEQNIRHLFKPTQRHVTWWITKAWIPAHRLKKRTRCTNRRPTTTIAHRSQYNETRRDWKRERAVYWARGNLQTLLKDGTSRLYCRVYTSNVALSRREINDTSSAMWRDRAGYIPAATYLPSHARRRCHQPPTSYRRPNFNARMHAYYPDFVSWRFVRPRRHRPAGTEREWERGSINYGVPTWKWSSLPPTRWFSARVREKGWE